MKRRYVFLVVSLIIVVTMLLAACGTATPAPTGTAAPTGGTANPLKVTLSFRVVDRAYLPSPDKVAQEIQAQLKEVGIEVTLKEMESAAFIDATSAGSEGFYLLGWNADYPDATNFYDYHFG